MIRIVAAIPLMTLTLALNAQLSLESQQVSYGDLERNDSFYRDLGIENLGDKKDFILRAESSDLVKIQYSSKALDPGKKEFIRIKYNPKSKGEFRDVVKLYVGSLPEPIEIVLKGNVIDFDPLRDPSCPSFDQRRHEEFQLRIFVGDEFTYKGLANAVLRISVPGKPQQTVATNEFGFARIPISLGRYLVEVDAELHESHRNQYYFNRNQDELNIYLKAKEQPSIMPEEREADSLRKEIYTQIYKSNQKQEEAKEAGLSGEPVRLEAPEPEKPIRDSEDMPLDQFKENNLVFVIDISESMRLSGKFHLLKRAMTSMVSDMRSVDRLAIITYSDTAELAMSSRQIENEEAVQRWVTSLQARGKTNVTGGIEMAYEELMKNYEPEHNNQIFLTSDGVYSREDTENTIQFIRKRYGQGIKVSTIGVKSEKGNAAKLRKIARYGQGNYLQIDDNDSADRVLVHELKRAARR